MKSQSSSSAPASRLSSPVEFDVMKVRQDFPILKRSVHGKRLIYLDNAATSQKPQAVIDAITSYYTSANANIHRGVHYLSEQATAAYDGARSKIRAFLNAHADREIIFTRGTTEAINLVAYSYGRSSVKAGDEIILSGLEHHSNIVPWQMLCEEKGARIRVIPVNDSGELVLDEYEKLLGPRTKLVAVNHVSNALGTINPIRKMIQMAHAHGARVLIDGAQSAPHIPVDVQELDCDFYAFSGHKVFGPTGTGALYGKAELLEAMPPFMGGGDMIRTVTFEKTTYADLPNKFEAGTPYIAGGIGLGVAIDYVRALDMDLIAAYEHDLLNYATARLLEMPGLRIIGTAKQKASVISFVLDGAHPHDIGTIVDREGVAIRTGHHCAQPVMQRFRVPATARASLAFYNTRGEIDILMTALQKVREIIK